MDTTSKSGTGRVRYDVLLRAIGSFLDGEATFDVNLVELPGAIALRFRTRADPDIIVSRRFTVDELVESAASQARKRSIVHRRRFLGSSVPTADGPNRSYRNLLRALGAELDDVSAYDIAIEEVSDELVLTYLFLDARGNYVPLKRMVTLHPNDRQIILDDAVKRRRHNALAEHSWGLRLFK